MSEAEIVMPDGGLKGMDTDKVAVQENDSAASVMSPMDINAKFDDGEAPLDDDLAAWEQDRRN